MSKEKLKTIDIKGKEYVQVNERIRWFSENYVNGSITTEIVDNVNGAVLMKAKITPDVTCPDRFFTGYAREKEDATFINKTSHIENCETSAVGRALGFMGIGVDTSIATAEEVSTAMANQTKSKPDVKMPESKEDKFKAEIAILAKKLFKSPDEFKLWRVDNNLVESMKEANFVEVEDVLSALEKWNKLVKV